MRLHILAATILAFNVQTRALTGGTYSTNPRYGAIVKIRLDFGPERNRQNCTGTFISPRHILTAGHCLLNVEKHQPMTPIKLNYSTFPKMDLFWESTTVDLAHAKFEVHPGFIKDPHASNPDDVGMIILGNPTSRPFLKLAEAAPRGSASVILTGYGCDKNEKAWSTDFKTGASTIADSGKLLKIARSSVEFCEGDSGSPILVETPQGLRIAGISSYVNLVKGFFGSSKDRAARVDSQADARAWINQQLKR